VRREELFDCLARVRFQRGQAFSSRADLIHKEYRLMRLMLGPSWSTALLAVHPQAVEITCKQGMLLVELADQSGSVQAECDALRVASVIWGRIDWGPGVAEQVVRNPEGILSGDLLRELLTRRSRALAPAETKRWRRLLRKLIRDPLLFLSDSKLNRFLRRTRRS